MLLSGLPGSGKSWFARRLAARINAPIVETDRVRRELFPIRTYSDAEHRAVRIEAQNRITEFLICGQSVIYDATNLHEATRGTLSQIAASRSCGVAIVQFVLPDAAIRANLQRRLGGHDAEDSSEAGIEVYELLRAGFQRARMPHWRCRSGADAERIVGELAELLVDSADPIRAGTLRRD